MTEHEEKRKAIAARLRLSREMSGLTQGQVAKSLDWHRPTVSEIEAGRRRVSVEELATLAEMYGVNVPWIVGEERRRLEPRCRPREAGSEGVEQVTGRGPRPSPPACPGAPCLPRRHRMNNRRAIARQAMAAALRTRLSVGYGLDHAVCVYDLAEKLGVEVRFLDLPSMEGMYSSASGPTIIVSSLRPPGRRAFTCAHELGHHNRSDGVEIDELVEQWDIAPLRFQGVRGGLLCGRPPHAQDGRLQCIRDSRMEHGGLHT